MNIDEQLENFLADLGVEMERPHDEHCDENSIPEISIFQSSRDHYGVFYRLDILEKKATAPHYCTYRKRDLENGGLPGTFKRTNLAQFFVFKSVFLFR